MAVIRQPCRVASGISMAQLPSKAQGNDFLGRFREIVSDPLNALISRHPLAGTLAAGRVILHNGLEVPATGDDAYYGSFSDILVVNRGVHEPLEEFVFQELLVGLPANPHMLELGAYWGHYSMWLKMAHPAAIVTLVEPEAANMEAGRRNFSHNGLTGEFFQAFVGRGHFSVDGYLAARPNQRLTILHADIQGFELEMLEDCSESLTARKIDYLFVSTHSQDRHRDTCEILARMGYRVEVSSDFDFQTTSFDGFVFASNPERDPVFSGFAPWSRLDISSNPPVEVNNYLATVLASRG